MKLKLQTAGERQALGYHGPHGPKDSTPVNRADLRQNYYRRSLPREMRLQIFGVWRVKRKQFINWEGIPA